MLALLAGLLWGLSLIKLGLSANFAMMTEPVGTAAQYGMLVSFPLTFLVLSLWGQHDVRLFSSRLWITVFGSFLVAGAIPLFAPLDTLPAAEALSFAFATLHAGGNVYFLCALARAIYGFDQRQRIRCLLYGTVFACLLFAMGAALPAAILRVLFPVALGVFVVGLLAESPAPNIVRDVRSALVSTPRQIAQYAIYGVSLGSLPSMMSAGNGDTALSWIFVLAIIAFILVLTRLLYPRTSQAPIIAQGVGIGIGLLCLLPLNLPLRSLFYTMLIAAWLLFWVFLCCTAPFAARGRNAIAFFLFLACFALGRMASAFLVQALLGSYHAVVQGVLLLLSCLSLVVPLSEILGSIRPNMGASSSEQATERGEMSETDNPIGPSGASDATSDGAPYASWLRPLCDRLGDEHQLTRREKEILYLLAQGRGRQYISDTLVISEGTAKTHIKHVYAKLHVHSKDELLNLVHKRR